MQLHVDKKALLSLIIWKAADFLPRALIIHYQLLTINDIQGSIDGRNACAAYKCAS